MHGNSSEPVFWTHRQVLQSAYESRNYSSFLVIQGDTLVPWPSLLSWGIDNEVLEPLGFTRGIARVEFGNDGLLMMIDQCKPLDLKKSNDRVVNLQVAARDHFAKQLETLIHNDCSYRRAQKQWKCMAHQQFVQLANPQQGLWAASATQLEKFIGHTFWTINGSRVAIFPDDAQVEPKLASWSDVDKALGYFYLVDPPRGFVSSNVFPYVDHDGKGSRLSLLGQVQRFGIATTDVSPCVGTTPFKRALNPTVDDPSSLVANQQIFGA